MGNLFLLVVYHESLIRNQKPTFYFSFHHLPRYSITFLNLETWYHSKNYVALQKIQSLRGRLKLKCFLQTEMLWPISNYGFPLPACPIQSLINLQQTSEAHLTIHSTFPLHFVDN